MKKVLFLALAAGFLACAMTDSALAIPAFAKTFADKYSDNEDLMAAAKEAKCNVCHYGDTKKNRNDYGMALDELLDKANYSAKRMKEDGDAATAEIKEALEKVEAKEAKAGGTFGELIKSGKLPGTAPE